MSRHYKRAIELALITYSDEMPTKAEFARFAQRLTLELELRAANESLRDAVLSTRLRCVQ